MTTMSYPDRLTNLGLHSLEYRRVHFDLVMCFKIVKNLVDLDAYLPFSASMCHHILQRVTQSNLVPCLCHIIIFVPNFFLSELFIFGIFYQTLLLLPPPNKYLDQDLKM